MWLAFSRLFSVRFFAHSVCGTVCRYFIIFQLRCSDSFLAVVGLVGVLCGERTFLDLTIVGFLF